MTASLSEHHYQSRDGLNLYYREYGESERAIVCLPGLTRNCKDFEKIARHLATDWRVITPDLRGRGHSQRDPKLSNYHPGTYVRDTWELLGQLKLDQVIVLGTSLGGLMAMIMADQQPQRLRAVIMNDIGPELPSAAIARIMQYAGLAPAVHSWEEAAAQARRSYEIAYPDMPQEFWMEFAHLCYWQNHDGLLEPDIDPAIGTALRKSQKGVAILRRLRRWGLLKRFAGINIDPWDSFREVRMPCLLLHGAISDVLTVEIIQRMQNVKPDLELATIAERGHAPTLDEPESRRAIDAFLGAL